MARCISRYAFLLVLDLLPKSTRAQVVCLAKKIDNEFRLGIVTLDNLLQAADGPPNRKTMKSIYRLLNKLLDAYRIPVVPQLLVDEAIRFDAAIAQHSASPRDTNEERIGSLLENQGLYGAWALGLRKARGTQNPTDLTPDGRAVAVVMLEFMRFIACFEVEDLVGPDGMPGGLDRGSPKVKALVAEADSLRNVMDQLADIEEAAFSVHRQEDRRRFATLRLSVHLNMLLAHATRMNPNARLSDQSGLGARWDELEIDQLLDAAHPMARTTRQLRNCIEVAQYGKRSECVLDCWDRLKQHLKDVPQEKLLSHQPGSWKYPSPKPLPAISNDDLLCSAASLISRYEKELGHDDRAVALLDNCRAKAIKGFSYATCHKANCRLHTPAM